jgi:hypothetical protein
LFEHIPFDPNIMQASNWIPYQDNRHKPKETKIARWKYNAAAALSSWWKSGQGRRLFLRLMQHGAHGRRAGCIPMKMQALFNRRHKHDLAFLFSFLVPGMLFSNGRIH